MSDTNIMLPILLLASMEPSKRKVPKREEFEKNDPEKIIIVGNVEYIKNTRINQLVRRYPKKKK